MLSACLYVYADKFTACVQIVCLPNATRACIATSLAYTFDVQRDRHDVRRSFKTRLHRVVFFVEPGVKINSVYYRNAEVIASHWQISGNESCFSRTVLQHTVRVRQLSSYVERHARLYFTGTVATEKSIS